MSNIQATLRVQAVASSSPGHCISEANAALHRSTASDKYATLFYGVLNMKEKSFTSTNAGHNPPMLINKGECCRRLETGGIVLGMLPDMPFEDEKIQLESGDLLLMYSDGITEAMDDKEEEYGEERLRKLLDENRHMASADLLEKIVADVLAFASDAPQQDDMTLVAVKIL
jgi:sigma-B regulation protein RsbU (phosphoserine phosphatase)